MTYARNVLENHLIASMTSGIKQTGATYNLPEGMAIEYGRLCYNQAIADVVDYLYELGKRSNKASELVAIDFADAVQMLVLKKVDV